MRLLKAFIAGSFIPFVISSLVLWCASETSPLHTEPLSAAHSIPYLWGIWNALYFLGLRAVVPGNESTQQWIYGATLGLIIACLGIFWLHLPQAFGWEGVIQYVPLIVAPIAYGLVWRYAVHPLNHLLHVDD